MSKFTYVEKNLVKNMVAILTIKRIPDNEIIKHIFDQTNKTISIREVTRIKQLIKKESYHWYKTMREGEYEYIHEFKERVYEIMSLQKKHHEIIDNNEHNPQIQQTSLSRITPSIYNIIKSI